MSNKSVSVLFLNLARSRAHRRAAAVAKKSLLIDKLILICILATLPISDASALDSYWDESNVETAFSPKNRRGANPVHQAIPVGVRRDALHDAAHAEAAGSGNFVLTVPILNLPGRGQDLNLALTHNSQIWHFGDEGDTQLDPDFGWPAPGWSLGFGKLVRLGIADSAMLIDSDGTRHPFSGTVVYHGTWGRTFSAHTTDGSLIDYSIDFPVQSNWGINSAVVRHPNGTVVLYTALGEHSESGGGRANEIYPTRITDAHGNYISITYRNGSGPAIDTITDTLGRQVSFHYDTNNALTAITGPGLNGETRVLMRLHYTSGRSRVGWSMSIIDAIYYPADNTGYWFGDTHSYTNNGVLCKVSQRRAMNLTAPSLTEQGTVISSGTMTRERTYWYPGFNFNGVIIEPTVMPTYSGMTESWSDMDSAPASTTYAITGQRMEITYPDGGRYAVTTDTRGLESQTELYSGDNKLLRKSTLAWETGAYDSPRVKRVETTDELNQVTAQEYSYGPTHNQIVESRAYDYGGIQLLRKERTDYLADPSYAQQHIFNLPSATEVYDVLSGALVSRTEYLYDTEPLVESPGVVQHSAAYNPFAAPIFIPGFCEEVCVPNPRPNKPDICETVCKPDKWEPVYDPATKFRGNLTQVKRYAQAANRRGPITELHQYDVTGNARSVTGTTCCEQVSTTYTLATQYAYPTTVTWGASNATVGMTTTATYDFNTGLPLSSTDANGRSVEVVYSQLSLRPERIRQKTGQTSTIDYETVYIYNDAALSVTEEMRDGKAVAGLQRITQLNGLGLARREQTQRTAGVWDFVDTKYDVQGRLWQQSRPYRLESRPKPVLQWNKIAYDTLGRVTNTVAPDGSTATWFYNEARRPVDASTKPGQTLHSVDARGRNRWSRFDAAGRLAEVLEPKANGSGSVFDPGSLATHYYYTALDQLQEIEHGEQWSGFVYDSLGRLTHQSLPEKARSLTELGKYIGTGIFSDVFTYDMRSNLTSHTDARGVKTTYDYNGDPLNRVQSISYDITGFGDITRPILPANSVFLSYTSTGDLTRLATIGTPETREEFSYNDKGLPRAKKLTFSYTKNFPLEIEYDYDNFDRLIGQTYPVEYGATDVNTRKRVHSDVDLAGRPKNIRINGMKYAYNIAYNSASQITSLVTGLRSRRLTETYNFDRGTGLLNRQRIAGPSGKLLDLTYAYQRDNLKGQTGQVTNITNQLDPSRNRQFQYDVLGRIAKVTLGTSIQPDAYWTQEYAYDAYGNRTQSKAVGTPLSQSRDGLDGIAYNPQTNRISTPGYAYDAEGNTVRAQRQDGAWQRFQYDAAGRLVSITDDSGNVLERLLYGAGRQRLAKINGDPDTSTFVNTYYAWSGNQVIAEYTETATARQALTWAKSYVYLGDRLLTTTIPQAASPAPRPNRSVRFHHEDRLGPRLVTDTAGNDVSHQPYAFGTEPLNTAIGDDTRRFTSYDRSKATGLDYAVNRHYDPGLGRFTQVDPIGMKAANLVNPQSLNMYAYVTNDPVNAVDPLGLVDSVNPESPCQGLANGTDMGGGFVCIGGVAVGIGDEVVVVGNLGSLTGGKGLLPGSSGRNASVSDGGGGSNGRGGLPEYVPPAERKTNETPAKSWLPDCMMTGEDWKKLGFYAAATVGIAGTMTFGYRDLVWPTSSWDKRVEGAGKIGGAFVAYSLLADKALEDARKNGPICH